MANQQISLVFHLKFLTITATVSMAVGKVLSYINFLELRIRYIE
jgi:hypothetical protein